MKQLVKHLSDLAYKISFLGLSAVGFGLVMPSASHAADITFKAVWSGTYFFNTASAVGYFTIDSAALPNPGTKPSNFSVPNISINNTTDPVFNAKSPITSLIKALTITVTGSGLGDGTYTLDDYPDGGVIWNTNGVALDFSKELVGQPTQGLPWGSIVSTPPGTSYSTSYLKPANYGGDFNIFDPPDCVPTGVETFVLATCSAKSGTKLMRLESFRAVPTPVPVPGAVIGVIVAGGLLGISRKKKREASPEITELQG
ncbi:hypothetical protein [Pseudanabaena sp. ABRG5-3]|uniref:hypothetical protein n=1 Tax=Pseudanabaena sp. ABRG5-3 TaxID=685565 RepID=UPI000DC721BF|nr:hypothetical protein [Pseudanabaena sp. ABRG5-3]BBC24972.1 hypothetical protein ABRG53_2715 [Pseudanabaena sp. ABRG5-3]